MIFEIKARTPLVISELRYSSIRGSGFGNLISNSSILIYTI
jgi:hypothetical protein